MKEAIITSSVLIVCIILLRKICKGRISARLQYMLWLPVAVRLVMPGIAMIFPDILPESRYSIMNMADRVETAAHNYLPPLEESDVKFVQDSFSFDELPELAGMGSDGPTAVFVAGHVTWTWTWIDWAKRIWCIGMVAAGIWMIAVNIRFGHKLRKSRSNYETKDLKLPVYTVKDLPSPCLYGLPGRVAVYLPEEMLGDDEKIKHILAHEYCHHKHGDVFWSALRCILLMVYWFHPLVWVAAVLSKQDCELASDEAAIRLLGEEERIAYGKTLLSLISRRTTASDIVCTATTMTAGTEGMKERIRAIAEKPRRLAAVLVLAAAVTGIVIISTFTHAKTYPEGTYLLEGEGTQTVTTSCFQITFPESFAGKAYYRGANGTDIIVYHKASDREIGRFCMMSYEEAILLADEREVIAVGESGSSPLLRSYIDNAGNTVYSNGSIGAGVPGTDSNSGVDVSGTDSSSGVDMSGTDSNNGIGVPGTDSNGIENETIYLLPDESIVQPEYSMAEESSGDARPIPAPENVEQEMLNLPFVDRDDLAKAVPVEAGVGADVTYHHYYSDISGEDDGTDNEPEEEIISEENHDYLPNEAITEVYIPKDAPCYLYIPADNADAESAVWAEITTMNQELVNLTDSVMILYQGRESMMKVLGILAENRNPYIGDAVKASKIASALPIASGLSYQYLELETETEPYKATLHYQLQVDNQSQISPDTQFLEAVLMFAAIENLDYCSIRMQGIKSPQEENAQSVSDDTKYNYEEITYERSDMEELFGELYPYSESQESMVELYNKILAYLEEKN